MRIEKDGILLTCLDEWRPFASPKKMNQWAEGRSACELARAWCGAQGVAFPEALYNLFASSEVTRGLVIETVYPEHRITCDSHGGEPRNADLAFVGQVGESKVAVTVEAKPDEPFGATIAKTISAALERSLENPRSRGVRRVEHLVRSLFIPRREGQTQIGDLRYQLLTAAAGTLAYAFAEGAATAVLVVHEFATSKTDDRLRERNAEDYSAFLARLGGLGRRADPVPTALVGPFLVPGAPLFDRVPSLYIGKIVTHCAAAA